MQNQSQQTDATKTNKGGRPRGSSNRSKQDVLAALKASRGLLNRACRRLGVSWPTMLSYRQKWPEVQQMIDYYRGLMVDSAESALLKAIDEKQGWAVCFALKTQGKDRGYVERQEHTGLDGAALIPSVIRISRPAESTPLADDGLLPPVVKLLGPPEQV